MGKEDSSLLPARFSPWHQLPCDPLRVIAKKFSLSDRIKLSLVCKPWRYWKNIYALRRSDLPRLVLPYDPNSHFLSWLNLSQRRIENFRLPELLVGKSYIGSSNGWLVFKDSLVSLNFRIKFFIFLFNPISGTLLTLPPMSKLSFIPNSVCHITVSSSQVSESLTVAGLFSEGQMVAVCKPGDKRWTRFEYIAYSYHYANYRAVERHMCYFCDVLFHRGTLFVLSQCCSHESPAANCHYTRQFKYINLTNSYLKCDNYGVHIKFISVIEPLHAKHGDQVYHGSVYLTSPIEGDILLIIRWYILLQNPENERVIYSSTVSLDIVKLRICENRLVTSWVRDIGDAVIFLGRVCSQMLRSKDFHENLRNCIVFSDDRSGRSYKEDAYRQSGVYNIVHRNFEYSAAIHVKFRPFCMDWFVPIY